MSIINILSIHINSVYESYATPSRFLASHFIDLKNACRRGGQFVFHYSLYAAIAANS